MEQVEVDVVAAQPVQALLAGLLDPPRIAAGQTLGRGAHAELRGDHDVPAVSAESLTEEYLGGAVAVDVGGVEMSHPRRQGGFDHLACAGGMEPSAEVVATEAGDGDLEAADTSHLHVVTPSVGRHHIPVPKHQAGTATANTGTIATMSSASVRRKGQRANMSASKKTGFETRYVSEW